MYIEINEGHNNDNKNVNNDILYNIIQKEQQGKFFVFFSKNELLINQWVHAINFFKKTMNQKNIV